MSLVEMAVSEVAMESYDRWAPMLPAREVSRRPGTPPGETVLLMDAWGAPADAERMSPQFTWTLDGQLRLDDVLWMVPARRG